MKLVIVSMILLLAGCTVSPTVSAAGHMADIVIYDRAQNRELPVYMHEGRQYVVGHPGNEYEIRLRNRQPSDILTVVSVDGVDVITGDTADWRQSGYVLGPHQAFGIKGWRKSLDRVAAFYFTALPDSYAARTGRPDHVGVIGVAVYRKKPVPVVQLAPQGPGRRGAENDASDPSPADHERSEAAKAAGSAVGAASRADRREQKSVRLGTGHGRSETSRVTYTEFERASSAPAELITIYYDSYRNLLAQGVIRAPTLARPDPFPGRFAPDPR